jgi:hypothetical protein
VLAKFDGGDVFKPEELANRSSWCGAIMCGHGIFKGDSSLTEGDQTLDTGNSFEWGFTVEMQLGRR